MGFFTNTRAQKEGEIILSDDRHHLYRVVKGKFIEIKKILTPPGNPKLWEPGQKHGMSVYDIPKEIVYVYNIDAGIWDVLDLDQLKKDDADSYALDIMQNLYNIIDKYTINSIMRNASAAVDKLPKNTI